MTYTIEIPEFDRFFRKARGLFWHWAENEPGRRDDWWERLRDILSGLRVGRLRVAETADTWSDIAVPPQTSPEKLPPAFLIGLAVLVTEIDFWDVPDPWIRGSATAQALAARLQEECPLVSGSAFAQHFGQVAYFAGGGRMRHAIDQMFETMQ